LISSALAAPAIMQTAAYAPSPSLDSLNIIQRSIGTLPTVTLSKCADEVNARTASMTLKGRQRAKGL
jgi:hypothetical protein